METASLSLLAALAFRGFALQAAYHPTQADVTLWRQPSNSNTISRDKPGIFLGLLLVPWLCITVGRTSSSQEWYVYGILTAAFSWMAWESSVGNFGTNLHVVLAGAITVAVTNSLLYAIIWHAIVYGMHYMARRTFSKVFTHGEWMVVASSMSLAMCCYLTNAGGTLPKPNHASIAFAGVLSAVITCPIMAYLKPTVLHKLVSPQQSNPWINFGLQLPFWFSLPLLGIEMLEFSSFKAGSPPLLSSTCELRFLNVPSWIILPNSLRWILCFLAEIEVPPTLASDTSSSILNSLPLIPRYGWIVYWLVVLAITLPLSPEPGTQTPSIKLKDDKETNISRSKHTSSTISDSQRVVLARKWFHFVAVLLFTPVTIAAPQLLSLSYAVALAILILFESARADLPMIQQFHERYLDPSKDDVGGHKLVISHMALIVGCAMPLWISEAVLEASGDSSMFRVRPSSLLLLQLWGVLSLGIGDAMGAIVGVVYGKMHWSGQNPRTMEGSLAMWVSMMSACLVLRFTDEGNNVVSSEAFPFLWKCVVTVSIVTLVEAYTVQIDNLVLPLVGVGIVLLFSR